MSLPNTITVGLKDHSMMLVDCEAHQLPELRDYFSFYVPGYKFMPMYKSRKWDGKIKLFNQVTRELNVGLYDHHSLVMITNSKASYKEVLDFKNIISKTIFNNYSIHLDVEPTIIT